MAFQSHSTLASSSTTDHHPAPWVSRLDLFPTAMTSDIHSLFIKSPTTSCVLDPLPTWLLKDVTDNVVPFLAELINSSIASGVVLCCLKHANVTPVPKEANIDQDNRNSYWPISNLPFVSTYLLYFLSIQLLRKRTEGDAEPDGVVRSGLHETYGFNFVTTVILCGTIR